MARRLVENKYANANMVNNPSTPVNRPMRRTSRPGVAREMIVTVARQGIPWDVEIVIYKICGSPGIPKLQGRPF